MSLLITLPYRDMHYRLLYSTVPMCLYHWDKWDMYKRCKECSKVNKYIKSKEKKVNDLYSAYELLIDIRNKFYPWFDLNKLGRKYVNFEWNIFTFYWNLNGLNR